MIKKTTFFLIINISTLLLMLFIKNLIYRNIGLDIPNSIIYLLEILIILFSLKIINSFNYKTYSDASSYGSHGTSRFQTKGEAKRNYSYVRDSFFVGVETNQEAEIGYKINQKNGYFKNEKDGTNNQYLIIGPPGSEKTTCFILPNILKLIYEADRDIIVTDPKQEIKNITEKKAREMGYETYTLNFLELAKDDNLNPLKYIDDEDDLTRLANKITESVYKDDNEKNSFWKDNLKNVLIILIGLYLYDRKNGRLKDENIGLTEVITKNVVEYSLGREDDIKVIGGSVYMAYLGLKNACKTKETIGNLEATIYSKLALYANKNIEKKLSSDGREIPIENFGKKVDRDKFDEYQKEYYKMQKLIINKIEEVSKKLLDAKKGLFKKTQNKVIELINLETDENAMNIEFFKKENYEDFLINYRQYRKTAMKTDNIKKIDEIIEYTSKEEHKLNKKFEEYVSSLNKKLKEKEKILSSIKRKPILLYIIMNDDDFTYHPIINFIFSMILSQLYKTARMYGEDNLKLKTNVTIFAEEFCTIGYIEELVNKLGNMRGRNIFIFLIVQSLAQLRDVYKKKDKNIISQCDNKLILGANDVDTAKEIEETLGNQTIEVISKNASKGILDDLDLLKKHDKENYTSRSLIYKSELMQMDKKCGIFIQKGRLPAKFFKCQYKYWEDERS